MDYIQDYIARDIVFPINNNNSNIKFLKVSNIFRPYLLRFRSALVGLALQAL